MAALARLKMKRDGNLMVIIYHQTWGEKELTPIKATLEPQLQAIGFSMLWLPDSSTYDVMNPFAFRWNPTPTDPNTT